MKKIILGFILTSLFANADSANNLLKLFAINENENSGFHDWSTGKQSSFNIKWKSNHPVKNTDQKRAPWKYMKKGIAILGKKDPYEIILYGTKNGYIALNLGQIELYANEYIELNKKQILKKKVCEDYGYGNYIEKYLVKLEGKKAFWMIEMNSAGSGMSIRTYQIEYGKEPKCPSWN